MPGMLKLMINSGVMNYANENENKNNHNYRRSDYDKWENEY